MTVRILLRANKAMTSEGYAIIVHCSHQNHRRERAIGFAQEKHFLKDEQMVSVKHPDYDVLSVVIADIKKKAKRIKLQGVTDVDRVMDEIFKVDFGQVLFMDFGRSLVADIRDLAAKMEKSRGAKVSNKKKGNLRVYENVLAQFEVFADGVTLQNLDYNTLMRFKNYQLGIGNSKSTVSLYLRTLRSIYNKGLLVHKIPDAKPFTGVFSDLKVSSYASKKKYLSKDSILLLEGLNYTTRKQRAVDLFLLQFYFGGCDLIDLYFLNKKQIRRGRLIFERGKTSTEQRIDLKIHPKAARILTKYPSPDEWLFPWNKDLSAYYGFRRNYQRDLTLVQEEHGIEVLPDGGNIAIKVARHTFGNMAKRLGVETDLLRELMGHERDDVDNFYKDKYPEGVRDNALYQIISSFDCVE